MMKVLSGFLPSKEIGKMMFSQTLSTGTRL